MNQKVKAFAAALLVATSVPAFADPVVYGKMYLALENIDEEATAAEPDNVDAWKLSSYASRFGIKGDFATDIETLKVIYQIEIEADITDEKDSQDNYLKGRNQFLGLAGEFGEFIVGRHDTPFKTAQGKLDLFNEFDADITALMASGEVRADNIFQYKSPKIADSVTVTFMGIPGEETESPPGADVDNGIADATALSVVYDKGNFYFAVAADSNIAGNDVDSLRLVANVTLGSFGIGALIQSTDYPGGLTTPNPLVDDEEVNVVSAWYQIDKWKLKLQSGSTSNYGGVADFDADLMAFGVDYSLSSKTTVGFHFFSREGGDKLAPDQSKDTFGVNMIHAF